MRDAVSKFTEEVNLSRLNLSQTQFCSIVKASKHTKMLIIQYCTILTNFECDFGDMYGCNIYSLMLFNCGGPLFSNWVNNSERLFNIISGIEKWRNLKDSIKYINLYFFTINEEYKELESEIQRRFPNLSHIEFSFSISQLK